MKCVFFLGKTNIPHLVGPKSKAMNPALLLQTHITGVISHGHDRFLTYVDICQYQHGSNLSINVILKTLLHLSKHQV